MPSRRSPSGQAPRPAKRARIVRVSEEMKAWSAALAAEVTDWPQVTTRAFFGFTGLYRNDKIFALLPRTRAMGTPNSLAFKFESAAPQLRKLLAQDVRIGTTEMRAARWHTFEICGAEDLRDALEWLWKAYARAGNNKKNS